MAHRATTTAQPSVTLTTPLPSPKPTPAVSIRKEVVKHISLTLEDSENDLSVLTGRTPKPPGNVGNHPSQSQAQPGGRHPASVELLTAHTSWSTIKETPSIPLLPQGLPLSGERSLSERFMYLKGGQVGIVTSSNVMRGERAIQPLREASTTGVRLPTLVSGFITTPMNFVPGAGPGLLSTGYLGDVHGEGAIQRYADPGASLTLTVSLPAARLTTGSVNIVPGVPKPNEAELSSVGVLTKTIKSGGRETSKPSLQLATRSQSQRITRSMGQLSEKPTGPSQAPDVNEKDEEIAREAEIVLQGEQIQTQLVNAIGPGEINPVVSFFDTWRARASRTLLTLPSDDEDDPVRVFSRIRNMLIDDESVTSIPLVLGCGIEAAIRNLEAHGVDVASIPASIRQRWYRDTCTPLAVALPWIEPCDIPSIGRWIRASSWHFAIALTSELHSLDIPATLIDGKIKTRLADAINQELDDPGFRKQLLVYTSANFTTALGLLLDPVVSIARLFPNCDLLSATMSGSRMNVHAQGLPRIDIIRGVAQSEVLSWILRYLAGPWKMRAIDVGGVAAALASEGDCFPLVGVSTLAIFSGPYYALIGKPTIEGWLESQPNLFAQRACLLGTNLCAMGGALVLRLALNRIASQQPGLTSEAAPSCFPTAVRISPLSGCMVTADIAPSFSSVVPFCMATANLRKLIAWSPKSEFSEVMQAPWLWCTNIGVMQLSGPRHLIGSWNSVVTAVICPARRLILLFSALAEGDAPTDEVASALCALLETLFRVSDCGRPEPSQSCLVVPYEVTSAGLDATSMKFQEALAVCASMSLRVKLVEAVELFASEAKGPAVQAELQSFSRNFRKVHWPYLSHVCDKAVHTGVGRLMYDTVELVEEYTRDHPEVEQLIRGAATSLARQPIFVGVSG